MRTQNRASRLTAVVAVSALLLAQAAPPSPPQAGTEDQQASDPPARVGRLAQLSGTVSFHSQDNDQWLPATLNYPVVQGYAFWTEANAQAVIEVSASRIAMAPQTELDVATLTDTAFQAIEPQGELYLRVRAARQDETYAVQTPRGVVSLTAPGRYDVVAGDTQDATVVTVVDGSAHVDGPGVSLDVGPYQAASITGTDTFRGDVGPAQHDAFLTAMLDSERAPPQGAAPPPAVAAMPGGEDFAQYGSWSETPEYGQVWYPQVGPDWVPYRDGSWAYVAPWGWTWVDSEPWGFAPFHYGRWAEIGGRWAWVPGSGVGVPVYAPALVTFFGLGAVAGVGIGAALAEGRIGWCPLGPREPFRPWYHASDPYLRRVNLGHAAGFAAVNRDLTINGYVNRHAATVVAGNAMRASRPVAASFQRIDPAQLAQARPLIGQQPLRPAATTMGVTPAVARQLSLQPPPPGVHAIAPGPVIHATPAGVAPGAVAGHYAFPPLRHPGQPAVPAAAGVVHPFTAAPALRTPPAPGQIAPPVVQHGPGFVGQGAVPHLPPPPEQGAHQSPQLFRPPGATFQQPIPPATFHAPPATPPVVHAPPPVVFHAQPPPVVVHPPPPVVFHAPPPPAVVHPPPPVIRAAPEMVHVAPTPPPQFHAPPPPPVAHAPPPSQNAQHKRPGEQ